MQRKLLRRAMPSGEDDQGPVNGEFSIACVVASLSVVVFYCDIGPLVARASNQNMERIKCTAIAQVMSMRSVLL